MAKASVVQKINSNILTASEAVSSNILKLSQTKRDAESLKAKFPCAK
ncbi:MAG: hypothetical protein QXK18_06220 [Candidatus Bathyarchaeia archaeon]